MGGSPDGEGPSPGPVPQMEAAPPMEEAPGSAPRPPPFSGAAGGPQALLCP